MGLTVGERYHVLLLGVTMSTGTDLILADLSLSNTTGYNPFSLFGTPSRNPSSLFATSSYIPFSLFGISSCNPPLEPQQVSVMQPDSAMGPALQAAFLMMEALGGKLLLFQTSVPNVGVGKITQRDNPTLYNTDSEHRLRVPEDIFFKKFAAEASKSQISIDVFSFRFQSFTLVAQCCITNCCCLLQHLMLYCSTYANTKVTSGCTWAKLFCLVNTVIPDSTLGCYALTALVAVWWSLLCLYDHDTLPTNYLFCD